MKKGAAILMVVFAVFYMIAFPGCASKSSTGAAEPKIAVGSGTEEAKADMQGIENAAGGSSATASDSKAEGNTRTNDARKVVKSAELVIQTVKYDQAISDFEKLMVNGGYIQSSSMQGEDIQNKRSSRSATYVVRVPAKTLDSFLNGAGKIGTVVSKNINGEDITQNYYDTETRLKTLKVEQARILELMSKANKIDDVLAIEQRLTDVENQIEQLTGEIKKWDSLISLSTVTVTINEVDVIAEPVQEGLGNQISSVFRMSVNALKQVFRYAILVITATLPFLAVVFIIAVPVILLLKRRKKKK